MKPAHFDAKARKKCASNSVFAKRNCLSVTPQRQSVVSLPGLSPSATGLVVAMAFVDASGFFASGCEAAGFAVLWSMLII
jgi:hypothetical protein